MRKELIVTKTLEVSKEDLKNIEVFLKKNDLLDDLNVWFAGFDDQRSGSQNAVAANLFYGNSRLMIISIFNDDVYYLQNSKKGLLVVHLGNKNEKFKTKLRRGLINSTIEIYAPREQYLEIKVTKNKDQVKVFRSEIK